MLALECMSAPKLPAHPHVDLWEGREPALGAYSCVAVCKRAWDPNWSALGGTRWILDPTGGSAEARAGARSEAARLAEAMHTKNRLLRRAERELQGLNARWTGRREIFGWQGGKGVILAPKQLSPGRLLCHGRLVQSLGGAYFASEDQGVGKGELRWIARGTSYTVGLNCLVDTGDPTAMGVAAGIYRASLICGLLDGDRLDGGEVATANPPVFEGLTVLVVGAGKVGLPLLGFLSSRGARCLVFDPALAALGIPGFVKQNAERGAAIDAGHTELLVKLQREGGVLTDEASALARSDVDVISPNGGQTDWLRHKLPDGRSMAQALADAKRQRRGRLRLILGAGNAQLIDDPKVQGDVAAALEPLCKQGIHWIPDPIVSPGGVIAVSHEQMDTWVLENVRADAYDVVEHGVSQIYEGAQQLGAVDALSLYHAFQVRVQAEA